PAEKRTLADACAEARAIWEKGAPSCEGALPGSSLPARYAPTVDAATEASQQEVAREEAQGAAGEDTAAGILPGLVPLPRWETVPPADNFRVFERGGRFIRSTFPQIGLPNPLEDPGKPDIRQSNRGPGTGSRVSIPVLNIHKARLNDPTLWFLGTSDHPGDFR